MRDSFAAPSFIQPTIPPRHCPLPQLSAQLGPERAHFVVEEIPAYPLSGSGEHVFFWIEKEGINTVDVAKSIASATGTKDRDVGYAGMKDRHAITRQWFSALYRGDDAAQFNLGEGARILTTTRHNNKLRTGHLIGNRFRLTLVGATPNEQKLAVDITSYLIQHGLPNYYGGQRFGHRGKNLKTAMDWLTSEADAEAPRDRRRHKKTSRFDNKLHPSVIQSEFFNRYLIARLNDSRSLLPGEVVRLSGTGTHFVVDDVERETPRRDSGDLILTGAMPGRKTLQSADEAAALEETIYEDMGLSKQLVDKLLDSAPGARRDLFIRPEELACQLEDSHIVLTFILPAGGYATQVVREYNDMDWMNPRVTAQPVPPST